MSERDMPTPDEREWWIVNPKGSPEMEFISEMPGLWEKDPKFEVVRVVPVSRLEAVERELAEAREDVVKAAGELLVPIPEPGTDAARLLIANVLLRRERDEARAASCSVASGEDTERLNWLDKKRIHQCSSWGYHDGCYRWIVTGQDGQGGNGLPTPIQATVREAIDAARSAPGGETR